MKKLSWNNKTGANSIRKMALICLLTKDLLILDTDSIF